VKEKNIEQSFSLSTQGNLVKLVESQYNILPPVIGLDTL